MVPNITKTGTSFRGAMLYYLHDKREEGESVRLTGERVAWTSVRNLMADDPESAVAIMRATANDQDRLKAEAGIKNTGRKSDKCVYAYSLAWHPDEKAGLTRAEMERAADESIRAIGAQDLQAVIVCHTDEPQPHVHVVINRVSPIDGRMHVYSNDRLKLSQWAEAYERERGKIWCEERVENNRRRQADGDYIRTNSPTPRAMADDYAKASHAANDNDAARLRDQTKDRVADLSARSRKMHSRHRNEWAVLSRDYQDRKQQLGAKYRGKDNAFAKAEARVKEQYRPAWRELFKKQNAERRGFEKREKRLMGKLENAVAAARYAQSLGRDEARGFLAMAFNYMIHAKKRREALESAQAAERRALGGEQRRDIKQAQAAVREERQADYFALRKLYNSDRAQLIDRQDAEKAAMQRLWARLNAERKRAFAVLVRQGGLRKAAQASPEIMEAEEAPEVARDFQKAARPKRKRKGRVRRRERE